MACSKARNLGCLKIKLLYQRSFIARILIEKSGLKTVSERKIRMLMALAYKLPDYAGGSSVLWKSLRWKKPVGAELPVLVCVPAAQDCTLPIHYISLFGGMKGLCTGLWPILGVSMQSAAFSPQSRSLHSVCRNLWVQSGAGLE